MIDSNELSLKAGQVVYGVTIDQETRCIHFHSAVDVVALKFPCCGQFYSCFECHKELADHEPERWASGEEGESAILCGVCKSLLTIEAYMGCQDECPSCGVPFNSGCRLHRSLYYRF